MLKTEQFRECDRKQEKRPPNEEYFKVTVVIEKVKPLKTDPDQVDSKSEVVHLEMDVCGKCAPTVIRLAERIACKKDGKKEAPKKPRVRKAKKDQVPDPELKPEEAAQTGHVPGEDQGQPEDPVLSGAELEHAAAPETTGQPEDPAKDEF